MFGIDKTLTFRDFIKSTDVFNYFVKRWRKDRTGHSNLCAEEIVNDEIFDKLPLPPEEFELFHKYCKLYGEQLRFSIPYFFYLFDYLAENNNSQLTVIDAYPNKMFLEELAERYKLEKGKTVSYCWKEIKPDFVDQGSVIVQILPSRHGSWLPTDTSINRSEETRKWIGDQIANYNFKRLGFVTTKAQFDNGEKCEFIRPEFRVDRHDILWFGNQRGSNNLEFCDTVAITGTYVMNAKALVKEFKLFFPNWNGTEELQDSKRHGYYYQYKDEKLENFRTMKDEDELKQAILRARPHLYKKVILCFCIVPDEIKNDPLLHFRVGGEEMEDERKDWLVQFLKGGNVLQENVILALKDQDKDKEISFDRARDEVYRLRKEYPDVFKAEKEKGRTWLSLF